MCSCTNRYNIYILELIGNIDDVESSIIRLKKFNILEIVRSGMVAMVKGNNLSYRPYLKRTEPNGSTFRIME